MGYIQNDAYWHLRLFFPVWKGIARSSQGSCFWVAYRLLPSKTSQRASPRDAFWRHRKPPLWFLALCFLWREKKSLFVELFSHHSHTELATVSLCQNRMAQLLFYVDTETGKRFRVSREGNQMRSPWNILDETWRRGVGDTGSTQVSLSTPQGEWGLGLQEGEMIGHSHASGGRVTPTVTT